FSTATYSSFQRHSVPRGGARDVDAVVVEKGDQRRRGLKGFADFRRHIGGAALAGVDDPDRGIRRAVAGDEFGGPWTETPRTESVDGEHRLGAHPAVVNTQDFFAAPPIECARRKREIVKFDPTLGTLDHDIFVVVPRDERRTAVITLAVESERVEISLFGGERREHRPTDREAAE